MRTLPTFLGPIATRAENLLRKESRYAVGVDLGSRYMKTVVLQPGSSSLTLRKFIIDSLSQISPNQSSDVAIQDNGQIVETLRTHLLPQVKEVGIAVSGPQVLLKNITLPIMSEKDVREHVSLELDRYIILDEEDVVWDVYCDNISPRPHEEQQEHCLIVAKKQFIKDRLRFFEQQGMKVHFVDVDTFALVNMVAYNYEDEQTWLIVHLGPTGILTIIIEPGKPAHFRQSPYEAEWYGTLLDRVLLALPRSDEESQLGTSERLLLQQFCQEISVEVVASLKVFSEMSDKEFTPHILLSGGYSMVEGLDEYVSKALTMPASVIDPFKKITVTEEILYDPHFRKVAPLLGVAVGVALREIDEHD